MRLVGALFVVHGAPALSGARSRSRRYGEIRECSAEIEARAPDHDRRAVLGERGVDGLVRDRLVLGDRRLVVEPPDANQGGRRLVGQDGEPPIQLRRVGGDHPSRDPLGDRLRRNTLAAAGGTKDRDDGDHPTSRARTRSSWSSVTPAPRRYSSVPPYCVESVSSTPSIASAGAAPILARRARSTSSSGVTFPVSGTGVGL